MDPIGKQKSIQGNSKNHLKEKLGEENSWESNAPKDLGGGFNKKSGTRKFEEGHMESEWQGTVKGKTTHTYAVDGKNDPEHNGRYKNINNIKQRKWDGTELT